MHRLEQICPHRYCSVTCGFENIRQGMALSICSPTEGRTRQRQRIYGLQVPGVTRKLRHREQTNNGKNPTANGIVERIHGTLGEQLRATVFSDDWSDDIDTLIQACAFALCAASPARGTYSPAQLAFGYDMIFRQKVLIDWERMKALRVRLAQENNAKENRKRLVHEYKVGDKILLVFKPYERRGKLSPSMHN